MSTISWLLDSSEPWTRYRTLVDLLERPADDSEVVSSRAAMLAHPQIQALIGEVTNWPGPAIKRHNDASHPIHKLSTLADFGLEAHDPGAGPAVQAILANQSADGPFQSLINIPKAFGGSGEDMPAWLACDAPVLLYNLISMGLARDASVQRAIRHLVELVEENGWRCTAATELGKFKGPGRRADPCPIANTYALKALSLVPELIDSPVTRAGVEMLLWHWEHQQERKIYMFGIGSDFRKLKYPFVWYDILHVADVLSRFPFARSDRRFAEMLTTITDQADDQGQYTATSMYRAWKGWSFANKKSPSPWLTFLVLRTTKRVN